MERVEPKLSIIVPSYNQASYLQETILSITSQRYQNLELIIIDGGSTDNSVDIIKKYENEITYWISEKDKGQSHAINKGLKKATGEWVAWMNSDDLYLPGAFDYIFNTIPHQEYDFLFGNACWGKTLSTAIDVVHKEGDKANLKEILKFGYSIKHIIPSQSVFIRRSILDIAGLLDESIHYCMDFDWYCRIFIKTDRRFFYSRVIGFLRSHPDSKTGKGLHNGAQEARLIAQRYIGQLNVREQKEVTACLNYISEVTQNLPKFPFGFLLLIKMGLKYGRTAWAHPHFRIKMRKQLFFLKQLPGN